MIAVAHEDELVIAPSAPQSRDENPLETQIVAQEWQQKPVVILTDSDCEQPNEGTPSRPAIPVSITAGRWTDKFRSTLGKPIWLLTVAIPLFLALASGLI